MRGQPGRLHSRVVEAAHVRRTPNQGSLTVGAEHPCCTASQPAYRGTITGGGRGGGGRGGGGRGGGRRTRGGGEGGGGRGGGGLGVGGLHALAGVNVQTVPGSPRLHIRVPLWLQLRGMHRNWREQPVSPRYCDEGWEGRGTRGQQDQRQTGRLSSVQFSRLLDASNPCAHGETQQLLTLGWAGECQNSCPPTLRG